MTRKYEQVPLCDDVAQYVPPKDCGFIYKITHKATGKAYVGQCTSTMKKRVANHLAPGSGCKHVKAALQKYGRDAFEYDIIEHDVPLKMLCSREEAWIAEHNTYEHGYNLTKGGEHNPMHAKGVREKHKEIMGSQAFLAKARIKRDKTFATAEYKERVGTSHIIAWRTNVDRNKHKASVKQSWCDDTRKAKTSERFRNLHATESHRKKQLEGMKTVFAIKKDPTLTAAQIKEKLKEHQRNSNREAARLYRERRRQAQTLA